ncbi:PadR family transcriptional regulator [Schnuerera sp. xch1]|uniref:PadR family transcriptional regulator n=1 Tax=Schnuerera sp. xch1 TaxID=2874283 RepID=UPI001CBEBA9E|nr:PadR family transcriptional regulator [Schnuerera sp. xch1]
MNNFKAMRNRQFPSKISTTSFVKLYILHLLKDKSYYGNEIIEEIKVRLENKWEPSPGMVYPLLRELEKEGYVKGSWEEPDKKSIRRYKLTDSGYKHYKVILLQNKQVFEDSLSIVQNVLEDLYSVKF